MAGDGENKIVAGKGGNKSDAGEGSSSATALAIQAPPAPVAVAVPEDAAPVPPRLFPRTLDVSHELVERPVESWAFHKNAAGSHRKVTEEDLSDDDLRNHFMVNLTYPNLDGVPQNCEWFNIEGRITIEKFSGVVMKKLRDARVLNIDQPLKFIYRTSEDKPMLIPSGTILASVYKTSFNGTGGGIDMTCTLVSDDCVTNAVGRQFLITPTFDNAESTGSSAN